MGSNTLSVRRGMKHQHISKSDDCGTHRFKDECQPEPEKAVHPSDGPQVEVDPEKGVAREHVVFNVGGMDCSGCANKMTRSLNSMSGISNVQVVFVTGMAEFDLEVNTIVVDEVIRKAERATGLRYSRITSDNQTLDVLMDAITAKSLSDPQPLGVVSLDALDRNTYRITFDPIIIGARSVLDSVDGAKLAPPTQDGAWADGKVRLFNMSLSTLLALLLTLPVIVLAWAETPVSYSTRSVVWICSSSLVSVQHMAIQSLLLDLLMPDIPSR